MIVNGTTVTAYVPFGSDDNGTQGAAQVVIENASGILPPPTVLGTDRVNSCTPAQTGEVVCSSQPGNIDLIPTSGSPVVILQATNPNGPPAVEYAGGVCASCGALVDDQKGLGIISTGAGFVTINLANNSLSNPISSNGEPVGMSFGYDPVHHRILNANYQIISPPATFIYSPPHFQIFDLSGATPIPYELNNDQAFFEPGTEASMCLGQGTSNSDALPETTAIDTVTNIAYVTFHTPSNCFSSPADTIALFDMSQATFTKGNSNTPNTWDTPGKQIQALLAIGTNGVDLISVESLNHVAIVGAGNANFAVMRLPSSSGHGVPSIQDYVGSTMPNDPSGAQWLGWHDPDGLVTYVSPITGRPMGVMMNNGLDSMGNAIGPTYLAIVDLNAMLAAQRTMSGHTIAGSVDLLGSGIVRFVQVQP